MLTAVPSENDRRLELFRLALLLIHRRTSALPEPLTEYFDRLLSEARSLARNPSGISDSVIPQAMQLANELMINQEFRNAFATVNGIEDVSPEIAHRALRTLEPLLASAD